MKRTKKVAPTQPLDLNQQLVDAVTHGDMREVCRCLDAGADPNTRGPDGRALFFQLGAWPCDPWPIRKELIKAGADVSVRDEVGFTILHAAAGGDQVDLIEVILDHGLDIDVLDHFGETALHEAVRCGALNAVKALIEREADLFAKNPEGETPSDKIDYDNVATCFHIEFELEEAMAEREGDEEQDEEGEVAE